MPNSAAYHSAHQQHAALSAQQQNIWLEGPAFPSVIASNAHGVIALSAMHMVCNAHGVIASNAHDVHSTLMPGLCALPCLQFAMQCGCIVEMRRLASTNTRSAGSSAW